MSAGTVGGPPLQFAEEGRQQLHLALILQREKRGGSSGSANRVRHGLHKKLTAGFAGQLRLLPELTPTDTENLRRAESYLQWLEHTAPARH